MYILALQLLRMFNAVVLLSKAVCLFYVYEYFALSIVNHF